jgi:hypothetical protein
MTGQSETGAHYVAGTVSTMGFNVNVIPDHKDGHLVLATDDDGRACRIRTNTNTSSYWTASPDTEVGDDHLWVLAHLYLNYKNVMAAPKMMPRFYVLPAQTMVDLIHERHARQNRGVGDSPVDIQKHMVEQWHDQWELLWDVFHDMSDSEQLTSVALAPLTSSQ